MFSFFKAPSEAQQVAEEIQEAKQLRNAFAKQHEHAAAMVLMLDRRLARLRGEQKAIGGLTDA